MKKPFFPKNLRQGMALVVVLALSAAIFILGSAFLTSIRNQGTVNPNMLSIVQADLFGQGMTQIAMLKLKEVPGPLYYASIAKAKGVSATYYTTYISDTMLNQNITSPVSLKATTDYQLLSSQMYNEMNFSIIVLVETTLPNGTKLNRRVEHIIEGKRTKI